MATEPRQVEVVCSLCAGTGKVGGECYACLGLGQHKRTVKPDSLTARMLDLAEAVDRVQRSALTQESAGDIVHAALAAVRAHKNYRRPE